MINNEKQTDEINIDEESVEVKTTEDSIQTEEALDDLAEGAKEEVEVKEEIEDAEEVDSEKEPVETEKDSNTPSEKKGIFGKKKDKKDKKDEQIEELTDRLKRTMAEFENFRKRTAKEKEQMFEVGAKTVIEKLLPTVDNFERGLQAVSEEEKKSSFVEGMDMVYKQLLSSLEEIGVKQIEAVGKEFDPNLHNAVMHEENEELGENIVSDELQKGYIYRETVVRYSMVKVAN
ncbi:molecular chaperone GrpE [Lachnotalea glycerini]|uniref:Protein GrpE n=1 Tax=Lachnotalea glycerini TaxID=1763509 RepID=A0A318EPS2_9FIRM|nr:nucleotide exchange factor GrpE [Lachnotalea glycerini]PXV93471.1 molecular chaperone GrpE [Lachnotalea glycerini]